MNRFSTGWSGKWPSIDKHWPYQSRASCSRADVNQHSLLGVSHEGVPADDPGAIQAPPLRGGPLLSWGGGVSKIWKKIVCWLIVMKKNCLFMKLKQKNCLHVTSCNLRVIWIVKKIVSYRLVQKKIARFRHAREKNCVHGKNLLAPPPQLSNGAPLRGRQSDWPGAPLGAPAYTS